MTTAQPLSFGQRLRRHRLSAGLSQEALAERAGLSARAISDLERGVHRAPYLDTITLLADALGLPDEERAGLAWAAGRHRALGSSSSGQGAPAAQATVPLPPLVGRAPELARLRQLVAGQGHLALLLAGEPGIGKTRLLDESVALAKTAGWTVVRGGCQRRSGQESFAPIASALASSYSDRSRQEQRVALEGCTWLVRLLPELAEAHLAPAPALERAGEQERRLMFAAVGRYLTNVAGSAGALLVLDDLQWAGADALDLLASLVRTEHERPLRVLGAYRSTEVFGAHPLAVALADLARDGLATELALGPLAAHEASELLATIWLQDAEMHGNGESSGDLRASVLRRTGGIPFFLISCAQAMQAGRLAHGAAAHATNATMVPAAEGIPWSVAQTVRQRAAALPQSAQALLAVAAIAGRVAPREVLLAVAKRLGQTRWQTLDAIEDCCRAGLLLEQDQANYSFTHDLIHEVAVADLSASRRVALHHEIADTLEQAPGQPPIEQLAYHYAQAGNQEKAVVYLEQTGDRAWALHANAEAAAHYQELMGRMDALGRTLDTARAQEKLGDALIILGRYDEALVVLEQAVDAHRARGDLDRAAYSLGRIAYAHARGGTARTWLAQAEPLREVARLAAAGHTSRGVAWLYASLAAALNNVERYTEELDAARRGAELARTLEDEAVLVLSLATQGLALHGLGRGDDARVVFEETVVLAERVGDLGSWARALMYLGFLRDTQGEFVAAQEWHKRAAEVATRLGDPPLLAMALCAWCDSLFWSGDWSAAHALCARAAAAVRSVDRSWSSTDPPLALGQLALAEGDWEVATAALGEAIRLATVTGNRVALSECQALLAEQDLLESRPEVARERLEALLDPSDPSDARTVGAVITRMLLAWAYADLQEPDSAAALAEQAVVLARRLEQRLALADALRISALIASRMGRWPEAAAKLEEAVALPQAMPYPYAEAKARYVYGQFHMARSEPDLAREQYIAALAICKRLGEGLYRPHIEQALSGTHG
jgi:transcriptional regulator with XRE-family HTH domain/tetratricopeptide (TPR) repeat protein